MANSKNKAIQYIQILEEYNQAGSLYDTTVYKQPGSPKSSLPPILASFSGDRAINKSKSQKQEKELAGLYSFWDAVEGSVKATDQAMNSAWQSAQAALTNMRTPSPQKLMGTTDEEVQATVQAIKSATSKTRLPASLAAKARGQRNPVMKTRQSRSPTKPRLSPKSKPPSKSRPITVNANMNTKLPPHASVYHDPSPEVTPVFDEERQPIETKSTTSRRLDPEEASTVQMEKKDLAAKRRAARAKKKGAEKKTIPQATTPTKAARPVPPSSIPTAGMPATRKSGKVACDASTATATSLASSKARTAESGPRLRRPVNKEPPGLRKDPPGVSRKGFHDDASMAPGGRKGYQDNASLAPRRERSIDIVQQQQLRSIVRQDLEDKPPETTSPWTPLLTTGVVMPQLQCNAVHRTETPPRPIRPCDIPRGSELRKKNESHGFSSIAGEFLNKAFGLCCE